MSNKKITTKPIRTISLFDLLGPVMTGPSSSHTAGAVRIGLLNRFFLNGQPEKVVIRYFGALTQTYKGHLTDSASIAGLLGYKVDAPEVGIALDIAKIKGIEIVIETYTESLRNPNTIEIVSTKKGKTITVSAITIGGGEIIVESIDCIPLLLTGKEEGTIIWGDKKKILSVAKKYSNYTVLSNNQENEGKTAVLIDEKGIISNIKVDGNLCAGELTSLFDYQIIEKSPIYSSFSEILEKAKDKNMEIYNIAIDFETTRTGKTESEVVEYVDSLRKVMMESIETGIKGKNDMIGGIMDGKDSFRLMANIKAGSAVSGTVLPVAVAKALAAMETNASLGKIVAAPTAGACGIIPGTIFAIAEDRNSSIELVNKALLSAALFGVVVAAQASVAGSLGGCQSEIGIASAMAASAAVVLGEGSPEQEIQAFSIALKNTLGLICDPVAGPVEVPCIKRNGIGVANALAAADMALSGIESKIPADEVIQAFMNVQNLLPVEFKCSQKGGLCITETALRFKKEWLEKIN